MLWYPKSSISTACLTSTWNRESLQSELDKNWVWEFLLSCGFISSNSSNSGNSFKIRVSIGLWSLSLSGFCVCGEQ